MIGVLFITSLATLQFQKVCANHHVTLNVIICSTCDVHCNACHSKSKVHKSSFLWGSIVTNDGRILLTIKGKWLEAVVHMIEFEFLNLAHSKQVQLLISIRVCGKFQLLPTSTLIGFLKNIQKFILKAERNLSVEGLVAPLVINSTNNVQHNVKVSF